MKQQHPGSFEPGHPLDFQTLKRKISIERVLHHAGVLHTLKHTEASLTGPCPLHGGDNPRAFVVSRAKNLWKCFTRCDAGGDVIELVKALHRCPYREVAHRLTEMIRPGQQTLQRPPPLLEAFKPFARRIHLEPDHEFLRGKRIHTQTAAQFEVGYYKGRGFLSRSIAVRLHDTNAAPLGYAARHLDPEDITTYGKWKLPPRLPKASLLYNYHRLHTQKALVVVECPWGVLRLHQLAIPALALLGTHLSHQQCDLLRTFPRIVLLMDADEAGRHAATRIADRLHGQHELSIAAVPEGLDPDQLEDQQLAEILRPFLRSSLFCGRNRIGRMSKTRDEPVQPTQQASSP